MAVDVKELLATTAFRPIDMEALLDPNRPTYVKFDPEVGYVPSAIVMKDGVDGSFSTYNYEPGGQRRIVNYADRPCRINTYGNSFTQCQQVSDGETWQERLAGHFGEPIRNFGCGGYGAYQSFRRAVLREATDLAAKYVILNVWDDDHVRNLDATRWIRSAWNQRNFPRGKVWPLHGLPWPHLRFDVEGGKFVELPGMCRTEEDLRALADPERFYEAFKDDTIAHLFTLTIGGEAPIDELEPLAEALGVDVDLRDPAKRRADAQKLHLAYGLESTKYVLAQAGAWARQQQKKLMVLLSYGYGIIGDYIEKGSRHDQPVVDYLEESGMLYVDGLLDAAEDYKLFDLPFEDYRARLYIQPAGAAVFGHYNPTGNHWYAFSIKERIVNWLDPKPPAYAD